jgi:predicted unusual protein kinase regulating ubiquinone biosynthesis (AarF/ABC1/UbiB family)
VSQTTLDQMRRYDATIIRQHYRVRPWQAIWRTVVIIWSFAGFLIGLQWDRLNQITSNPERAAGLRDLLTRLGPTYIKVGQALSTRPDLVRKDFLEELTKLQDQLPPFPTSLARAVIEQELDRSLDDMFSEFSAQPVAAASLGQVYEARLRTGEAVAVKVQRPNLLPVITLDLYLMRWAAGWMAPWLPLNLGHDLTMIVDEFGSKLFEEIDYMNEGRNAETFAANFQNDITVKVPAIFWRYSGRRVLTLEWINGFKLTALDSIRASHLDQDALIEIGVTAGLRQLLEFGFFHADPHPGNLFALPSGQMAFIDFGMMDQLSEEMKETLVDAVVHLINQDYEALTYDFVKLGFLTPNTNIGPIVPAIEAVMGEALGASVGDFNFRSITDQFASLMYEYPFRLPAKFALIIRSLVTQEGIALSLNPNFKIVDVAYPFVARRLLMGESPQLRRRLIEVLFRDGKFQWERLENLIAIARSDTKFDLLPTAQLGLQYLLSQEGQYLRQQLILALIEDDRFHTAEVQRLWNLIKDDVKPSRLLNVALDALAGLTPARVLSSSLMSFNSPDRS